jgi:hypothetical protein
VPLIKVLRLSVSCRPAVLQQEMVRLNTVADVQVKIQTNHLLTTLVTDFFLHKRARVPHC